MSRRLHTVSWVVGLAVLGGIIWYFRPSGFWPALQRVGFSGALGWLVATLVARLLTADVLARLLGRLGSVVGRMKLFSIGWLRTFANQVVPLTGIAVYLQQLRQKTGASWHDLAAVSLQQTFVSVLAIGIAGIVAAYTNRDTLDGAAYPLLAAFLLVAVVAAAAAGGTAAVVRALPRFLRRRIAEAADSVSTLTGDHPFTLQLAGIQIGSMLMRAARTWLLFAVLGTVLDWREALLIVALADMSMLVAITPGGLGIREAIVIGGATLIGVPTETAVTVSLIDRLFVIATAGVASLPAIAYLAKPN